ncbi:toxic anion resistance protein [Ramlibacter albus]|uniref:Toxic anion resistance protein n=1 Tax=Ramlibacter albus TaxID=2079448 RepID=A0A923M7H0_9BURK|nr:hypothetical protein [Ramlibacter albus]MBC5764785.1 hypothetical protein [Ramlibacter albus]
MSDDADRTASLMTPAKLAQLAQSKPKPAATPAAWLDKMASDAGAVHVARLMELRAQFEAQPGGGDLQGCTDSLAEAGTALDRLDFSLLGQNKGLFARMTGKGKTAGAEFARQYEQVLEAAERVSVQAKKLATHQQAQAAAADRALVEFEVETNGLEKIIDQGARWLQDMRGQLKTRQAEAGGDEEKLQQVKEDAARCELLVARLKLLRAASSAAQQARQAVQATAARRLALVQSLQQRIAGDVKEWQARMSPVAAAAGEGSSPAPALEGPQEAQRVLKQHLGEAIADCGQLREAEKSQAEGVAALAEHLRAAM